jgi:hypothetical protein
MITALLHHQVTLTTMMIWTCMAYDSMNQGIKGIGASGTESELHLQRLAWVVLGTVYSVLVLDIASHNTEIRRRV